MKTKIKPIIYTLLLVLFPVLFFSCSSPLAPMEENGGSINLVIEKNSRKTSNEQVQALNYEVTVKSSKTEKRGVTKEGEPLVIENLPMGTYTVSVKAEDDDFIYVGEKEVKIESEKTVDVNIKLDTIQKGGQISLYFRAIYLDKTATFNVEVLYNDAPLFTKKDIKATDIIGGKYIIPIFLPDGNYKVKITGGHVTEEQYVVNNNEEISVKRGVVTECEVKAVPYKTIYLDGDTTNAGTGGNGTKENPIHSIQGAINLIKDYTEPVKIIVTDKVEVSTFTVELNAGQNITFIGQDKVKGKETIKASITDSAAKELLKINGANVTLVNIDVAANDYSHTYPSITLNSGSLTLYEDVYVEEVALKNNSKLSLRAPLVQDKKYKISLDTFSEDKEVFDLTVNASFDTNNIELTNRFDTNKESENFYVDNRGLLKRKLYDAQFTLKELKTTYGQYEEVIYRIKENDKAITEAVYLPPLDYADGAVNSFTVPNLKKGVRYEIELYTKHVRTDETEKKGGLSFSYPDFYYSKISRTFSNIDPSSPFEIKLTTDSTKLTSSLKIVPEGQYKALKYPLNVTLTSSKGEEFKKTLEGFGYYINYLTPDTYTVTIETEDPSVRYTPLTPTVEVVTESPSNIVFREEKVPVFYVGNKQGSANEGTLDNPFTTLKYAITKVSNITEPITLIIETDLTVQSSDVDPIGKIIIDKPLTLTLTGKEIPSFEQPSHQPTITAPEGLFTIQNANAKLTIKNLDFDYQRPSPDENNSLIEIIEGEVNILQNVNIRAVVIDAPDTPISAIRCGNKGRLYTSGFILNNNMSYILLEENAKLKLLNTFNISDFNINLKSLNPSLNKQIIESANGDNSIIEASLRSLAYVDNAYDIDKNGRLILSDYIRVSDLDEYRKDFDKAMAPVSLNILVENEAELKSLGPNLRGFPKGAMLDLKLKLLDSITTIDGSVFNYDSNGLQSIKSLTIESNALKSIGDNAFKNCDYLEAITLPEGIKRIGNNAFDYCFNLVTINLPSTLEVIGDNAFRVQGDQKDTIINTDDASKLRYFGANALSNRRINASSTGLNIVGTWNSEVIRESETCDIEVSGNLIDVINDTISIPARGGESCDLKKIMTLSDAVSLLQTNEDSRLAIVVSIKQEDDISSLNNALKKFKGDAVELYISPTETNTTITSMTSNAFSGCTKLSAITIPGMVKEINPNAFSGCTMLSKVIVKVPDSSGYITIDKSPWKVSNGSEEVIIKNNETPENFASKITGQYSSYNWTKALNDEEVTRLLITPSTEPLNIFAYYEELPSTNDLQVNMQKYGGPITLDLSESSFKNIPSGYFRSVTNLQSITLPQSLEVIGETVFDGCTALKTITIPKNVYSIGASVFTDCTNLTDIVFDDTASRWEFYTTSLEKGDVYTVDTLSVDPKQNVTKIKNLDGLDKFITIGEAKSRIDAYNNDWNISSGTIFTLPVIIKSKQELQEFGKVLHDHSKCQFNLSLIMEGEGNNVIGSEFNSDSLINPTVVPRGCYSLHMLTLHTPNITINSGAFMNCVNLFAINFDTTTTVQGGAFTGCRTLQKVSNYTVSSNPTCVMNGKEINSFLGVEGEGNITIPSDNSIESIADYAFYGSNVEVLDLGSSIKQIGVYAFANSQFLSDVKLGTNQAFNTLNTGLFYNTNLGAEDPTSGAIKPLLILENVTTIMPGAIYTENYKKMSADINPNISFRSQNVWHNEGNTKTFDPSKAAEVLQHLVKDTVIGTDGIPTNETYTNVSNDPVPVPSPNPGP